MKRLIWTVVFRDDASSPQQELVRYTEEAANSFAAHIIENGGVAIVVEGDEEDTPDTDSSFNNGRSSLKW
jgi:hypothetical protein